MSNDVKKTIIYSETKLINHLKEELDKSKDTNYQLCLKYMKNLGQLSAQKDKEIEDASYNLLFSCISTIFRRADKPNVVPLALRIISLKVLTNTALILFERQHVNPSSVAYSLIIKEISNEVVKPNYSVSFLITIFDAIFLCSQARCVDDKATVAALLTLGKISRNLRPGAKDSLAIALDIDLIPFNQNYKYGSSIKDINRILQEIGCIRLPSDNVIPQASQIPQPKNITSLETRLAAQEFLMQQNPDELAKRVMDGFKRFTKIEGYRKPDTIDDLIAILIEGPAEDLDEQSLITEATVYMVEQALDKLQKRSKYIPPQMQSEFIAMLIHTFDSTLDGFEECKGPATTAAIKHSIDINQILVPFLVVWAEFEFVRSSETRYKNLVIEIFKQLVYLDNADQHVSSDILMANNSNLLASLTTSMPQTIPGALPGSMPQTIPGAMPQAIPGALPGTIQPNMPGNLNVNMAGQMPQSIPGAVAPNVAGGNVVGGIAAGVSGGNVAGVPPVSNLPSNGSASTSIGNLNEDDNYLMDFIKPLDFLPLELYSQLYDLCSNYPTQSNKILNAVNEYVSGAPASQEFFLRSLLALCVHDLEIVHLHAIEIIRTYYKHGNEIEEINRFAVENLEKSVTLENPMPHLELFFAILDLDFSLFLNLMDVYAKSPKQGLLREKLKQKIPTMHIGIDVIAQALEVAPENKHKTNLLHFYLSELAKKFSVPPDLVELLKKQFLRIHDSRYLIPIIPNLTEEEFKKYLPNILTLESHALKRAITSLLTSSIQPIKPVIFLIELHKPEIAGKYLDKAIEAMELCFEQKDIFTYQLSISAVDAVIRNKYYHLIMDTLLQMVKTYPSSHKYILYHVVQPLIFNNITQMEEPWKKLKRLLYETKPTSCKLALSLPADKVKDLIEEYPDYQSLLVGTAKDKSKTRTVISQDVLDVLNSTNTAPKEEEKAATTEN